MFSGPRAVDYAPYIDGSSYILFEFRFRLIIYTYTLRHSIRNDRTKLSIRVDADQFEDQSARAGERSPGAGVPVGVAPIRHSKTESRRRDMSAPSRVDPLDVPDASPPHATRSAQHTLDAQRSARSGDRSAVSGALDAGRVT